MVILSNRNPAAEKAEDWVLLGMNFGTLLAQQPDSAVHQQYPKQIHNPMKAPNEADAQQNKNRAHNQSPDNSPEEHFVLIFTGHAKIAEDQEKHEKIVDAQRKFDDVTGHELQRGHAATPEEDDRRKRSRQGDPHGAPGKGLAELYLVRTAMKDAKVQRQHGQNKQIEESPEEDQRATERIFNCRFPMTIL